MGSSPAQTTSMSILLNSSSDRWAAMLIPLLAATSLPSTEISCHSNSRRSLMRLAERSGSMAAENDIMENCGTRRNPIRIVMRSMYHGCRSRSSPRRVYALARAAMGRLCSSTMDPNRRRQGGRGRRLDGGRIAQLPWTEVRNPYSPMEVLSADQLEAIHLTSLRILEELGMEVMSPRALAVLEAGGAEVDLS